ncbi:S9 family peptidase [Sciscionella sediminilitoris]|uniref:S9 family peptidase n=1 Tax=Sciscionella sediminilitoris TaxID=1445613 RepID=UPI0004DF8C3C|nr:DPP IV N-terminal domain-containing protein [Sciscionella sp. SE31]
MTTPELAERYARAEALLPHKLNDLIRTPRVRPNWIRHTETFWYRNKTPEGSEFVFVDAAAGQRRPAFDHARLAEALGELTGEPVDPVALPFSALEFHDNAVRFVLGEQRIEVSLDTYTATVHGPAHSGESLSPDGRWAVGFRGYDLCIRDTATDAERLLTTDGAQAYTYASMPEAGGFLVMQENLGFRMPPLIAWSPDSKRFVTHRLDQRALDLMHLVRSAPFDGGRPKPMSYRYAMPGDASVSMAEYFVFEADTGAVTRADCEPFPMPFLSTILRGHIWWNEAGTRIRWLAGDRTERTARLYECEPETGAVTELLEESSDTTVQYGPDFLGRTVHVLASGEVLWWSERSGWGHLYLYRTDGTVGAVTSGDWLVRAIVGVDEQRRQVVFTASGREPGTDVYLQELYSVSLDGGEITALTADGLDHDTHPSSSGRFFVDVMSRFDTPAVSVLRDASGAVVLELETADASALYAAGFTPAERVVVKAADGVTDIYCALYKPFGFDPDEKYPVLDEIYPGPQASSAPLRFPLSGGVTTVAQSGTVFAALGFAVVAIDGRGTPLRHKAFQDHARLAGDGQYIDDHVAAIRQLAETRPWLDLDRVGIFGHSGGGYASARAILQEPGFYRVAVSSAGDHDDRIYHAMWGEKYYGPADEFDFEAHANVSLAGNLEGKLLLIHGEMDDNVTPHLTMRLADALMAANKDFDLLIVPNADHSMLVHAAYWMRRRWDYFVRHLMGATPPDYRIADIPLDPERLGELLGG